MTSNGAVSGAVASFLGLSSHCSQEAGASCNNSGSVGEAVATAMLIGTRQRVGAQRVKLVVDDRLIEQVSTTKYLGVKIDSHLSWEQHIDFISV